MSLYSFLYKPLSPFFKFFFRVKLSGSENEPKDGAYLACPNHLSNNDVLITAACLKRKVHFFAKAELFKIPVLKQLITALGAFPVKRGAADVSAIKKTIQLLDEGKCVGLYPQGTRRRGVDPRQTEVKAGIAMIVYRKDVPILPICIQTKKMKILPFRKTFVTLGKPIYRDELGFKKGTKSEYENASHIIFDRITEMLIPDGDTIK